MNIQPADRLRLQGAMLQFQNDRLMQNVFSTNAVFSNPGSCRDHCLASMKF